MSAALTAMFDRQGMDDSRHSVRSVESTSDNFYSTAPWEVLAPAAKPTKGPTGTLRVIGKNSVNVNMAMAELLNSHGCVVEHSEQHRDLGVGCYFQRVEFKYDTMRKTGEQLEASLHEVCGRLGLEFQLSWGTRPKRLCIFVSKYDHVLWEILLRHKAGELECDIPLIVSNHEDLRPIADAFGIRFEVFKITKDTKRAQEDLEIALCRELDVDIVVLARYMQIMSDEFCDAFTHKCINIHHSFLPAFIGSKPYHRAFDRGVKLIGATAHYATANLDEGPIIEQDVERVSHRDSVDDLLRKGRGVERRTLMVALRAHLEDRIIVYGNKTVVFAD